MVRFNQPKLWTSDPNEMYVPISYQGEMVGFCKPNYATQLLETLNGDDKFRKALQLACYDLVAKSGGSPEQINALMQQYLQKAQRPKEGIGAIALYLKERQQELDLTDEEFIKFCNSFRLSPQELDSIYSGQEIDSKQLAPLSRILGLTVDEVIAVLQGSP